MNHAIIAGQLFDGVRPEVRRDQVIQVEGDRIAVDGEKDGQPPHAIAKGKEAIPIHKASFQAALRAGVRMAAGTAYKHRGLWLDLKLMADYGCPPAQALLQATGNAAEFLGMRGQVGSLEPGAYADVAAFAAKPLDDFANLRDVRLVLKGGEPVVCGHA